MTNCTHATEIQFTELSEDWMRFRRWKLGMAVRCIKRARAATRPIDRAFYLNQVAVIRRTISHPE